MTQNCYKIKGIYYFRKQVFQHDFRKSLKKLCGKKLYNKLLKKYITLKNKVVIMLFYTLNLLQKIND